MSFRLALCAAILGGMAGARPVVAASPADRFVAGQFAVPPPVSTLVLDGALANPAREILGYALPSREIRYWAAEDKTVWILDGRHKTGLYLAGFAVQNGRLSDAQVLEYRPRHGQGIRERSFTRQFNGAALTEARQLDRRIDGITGATISVNSMKNLARLALYLDSAIGTLERE